MKIKTLYKITLGIFITGALCISAIAALYIKGLPYLVASPSTIKYIQNLTTKYTNANLIIEKPVLKTAFTPDIEFSVEKIYLEKDNTKLLDLNKFNTKISLKKIFLKNIIIKKLVAESIYADINKIQKLIPQNEENKQKSDWNFDIFDALLGVRNCEIIYSINPDTKIHLQGQHIGVNNAKKIKRNVYFQLFTNITRKDKKVALELKDNGNVFFENNHFYIKNCPLSINNSDIFINLTADKKHNFDINLFSNNFNINDIIDFLNTQIIENSIQKDALAYFNDINGHVNFKLNIKNKNLDGNFKINNIKFKIKDVDNVPITLTNGNIDLKTNSIKLTNFKGYYDNNTKNKIDFEGTVKDYLKSIDTDIVGNAVVRNDFFKKHLSKMTGTNLEIKGDAPTRIKLKSKSSVMDFVWLFMLKPGQNIKVANDYLPFEDTARLMKSDMHLENMILDIKSLDYHMIPADKIPDKKTRKEKNNKNKPKPIFRLKSSIDIARNNYIKYVGFEIPEPLPSELLNVILKQEIFKKGKIGGNLFIDNLGSFPILKGSINMDRVLIPSQMTFIKEGNLEAKDNLIHLNALGGYRRAKFNFNGDIINKIQSPVVVKDINLSLANLDMLKVLETFNNQNSADNVITTDEGSVKVDNLSNEFDIRNIIIEKGKFHLDNGTYKDITFGNLDADLTLNKNGIINIKSNRFDFAQGQSSLRAMFDLINKKYNVKLGILNVDSDTIANALLDLKKEITGKASGFMDISTDETMKLNGTIKFKVLDGAIEKIGLVEYVLKCASLLRNTVTMINPAIFADIVNVPDGKFDKITGSLKIEKNIVTNINIKTYSPQLSTYTAGRYNIENGDTSLRIYTKFSDISNGFTGFLRKISLNSLANRIPLNNKNDANYYAIELAELPEIDANEKDCQIYLTRVEGDVVNNNYISSLKKLK